MLASTIIMYVCLVLIIFSYNGIVFAVTDSLSDSATDSTENPDLLQFTIHRALERHNCAQLRCSFTFNRTDENSPSIYELIIYSVMKTDQTLQILASVPTFAMCPDVATCSTDSVTRYHGNLTVALTDKNECKDGEFRCRLLKGKAVIARKSIKGGHFDTDHLNKTETNHQPESQFGYFEKQLANIHANITEVLNVSEFLKSTLEKFLSEAAPIVKAALIALLRENTSMTKTCTTHLNENISVNRTVDELLNESASTKKTLTTLSSEHTSMNKTLTALSSEHTSMNKTLTALSSENTSMKKTLTALSSENTSMKKTLTALSSENTSMKKTLSDMKDQYTVTEDKLNQLNDLYNATEAKLNILLVQINTVTKENCDNAYQETITLTQCKRGMPKSQPRMKILLWNTTEALCDTETDDGGWVIIQRRACGQVKFYRGWDDYKTGFGSVDTDYWLGLDNIHRLTSQGFTEMRVDLRFHGSNNFAVFSNFRVNNEDSKYQLTVGTFTGVNLDGISQHNGTHFTTNDRDNDAYDKNCADERRGGWWYRRCYRTGHFSKWSDINSDVAWKESHEPYSEMKVRYI